KADKHLGIAIDSNIKSAETAALSVKSVAEKNVNDADSNVDEKIDSSSVDEKIDSSNVDRKIDNINTHTEGENE
ncbi:MAG: hypothetical protein RR405_04730, partial [Clostridia bacterium]